MRFNIQLDKPRNIPYEEEMTTIFSNFPQTPGTGTSCPGTPMSGISTVAIKDGHEGIRHGHHHQGDPAAQERLARLGAYGTTSSTSGTAGEDGESYFQRVAGWRDHEDGGDGTVPPEEQQGLSEGELTGEDTDDIMEDLETPPGFDASPGKPNLTKKIADKLNPMARLPLPPRRSPSSFLDQIPNPPCPTPATPHTQARNPLSQAPSTHPGPNNTQYNFKSSSSSSTSASNGNGLATPFSAPSPASTVTTNSVREAKHRAKMLGPMTYDEGVVDTTSQNGAEAIRSPSPPIFQSNRGVDGERMGTPEALRNGVDGERMDLEPRVEGSRKERLEDIEERIVGGEHGAFRE